MPESCQGRHPEGAFVPHTLCRLCPGRAARDAVSFYPLTALTASAWACLASVLRFKTMCIETQYSTTAVQLRFRTPLTHWQALFKCL